MTQTQQQKIVNNSRKKFQKALLTGATDGIGLSLAMLLMEQNFCQDYVLVGRSFEKFKKIMTEKIAANITIDPQRIILETCDLLDQNQLTILTQKHSEVDLLINNAGVAFFGNFNQQPWPMHLNTLSLNAITPLYLSWYYGQKIIGTSPTSISNSKDDTHPSADASTMAQSIPSLTIVNISSLAAELPMPFLATYGASKAVLNSWHHSLIAEMSNNPSHPWKNICLQTFVLGGVSTQFIAKTGAHEETLLKHQSFLHSPEFMAHYICQKIMQQKSGVFVPGFFNRCVLFGRKFLPAKWFAFVIYRIYRSYQKPFLNSL